MNEFLNYTFLKLGEFNLSVLSILKFLFFVSVIILILNLFKRLIFKAKRIEESRKYAIYNLIKYVILVFSSVIGLQIFGFNISVLIAGSAALLVGLGLGLQNLFSDFISGIIILMDSSIKVNDIIEVNGLVCKVQEINLRTTTVLTRDDKYIILPNTDLTRNRLINWTHSDISSRFEIMIGVDYSSDVNLVMKILKEATINQKLIKKVPEPFVRFTDFGDSSLNFEVFFWSEEVFRAENIKSEIRVRIYDEFKKYNIKIPFPQRVVHIVKN